jgi:menaquinone-9 beta-reductase
MPHRETISIVGGGLAGLALGIALRQRGVPVVVREAGRYPRHRVCGEFVSGRGQGVLQRLGIRERFLKAGAIEARTVAFFLSGNRSPSRRLEQPALCLSRFAMDALLADHFRGLGGELQDQVRHPVSERRDGVVWAAGRPVTSTERGWHWFGIKIHARNVELECDLEMHGVSQGYCGVSRLPGNEFNLCALLRRRPGDAPRMDGSREQLFRRLGTSLEGRLRHAIFDEPSFCSVGGLSLRPRRAGTREDCVIGDALTMIPPVTGNGMSMAFEAAELAAGPLAAYSEHRQDWEETRGAIAGACDRAFRARLWWAGWLQRIMFARLAHGPFGGGMLNSEGLWRFFFARTR